MGGPCLSSVFCVLVWGFYYVISFSCLVFVLCLCLFIGFWICGVLYLVWFMSDLCCRQPSRLVDVSSFPFVSSRKPTVLEFGSLLFQTEQ